MRRRYSARADFYLVYVREAHPSDGWRLRSNDREGVVLAHHRTAAEREEAARSFCEAKRSTIPILLDRMDDAVEEAYAGFPDRLYIIDRLGRVSYKGGRGPLGFDSRSLEEALILTLLDEEGKTF